MFTLFSSAIFRHEVRSLWASPATVVFVGFAWLLAAGLTFFVGNFFAANMAAMDGYFAYLPWVYVLMLPALGMGLYAEDKRRGHAERLLTLPLGLGQLVVARFAVLWLLVAVFLLGSWPMVASIGWLGSPDWGAVLAGYVGQWLLAGVLLGFTLLMGTLSASYVVAFTGGVALLAVLLFVGVEGLGEWLVPYVPAWLQAGLADTSLLEHTRRFTQGLVDGRSVTYFIGLILLALYWQMAALMRRYARGTAWPWLVAGVLALVMVTGAGRLLPWRVDVSADELFTLSAASEHVVRELTAPVTLTLYQNRGPDMPATSRILARRMDDLLADLKAVNPAKVRVERVDPGTSAAAELAANRAGMVELPLADGGGYYFGLVATMNGRNAVIPAIGPERTPYVEFDVVSLLAEAQKLRRKQIAVLGIPNLKMGENRPRWLDELAGFYDIDYLLPGNPQIPDGTDALITIYTPYLPQESLYAVDQYLAHGGRVLMLLDPLPRTAPPEAVQPDRNSVDKALNHPADLLRLWGVNYNGLRVVADPARAAMVNDPAIGLRSYPFWLSLGREDINQELPFTGYVDKVVLVDSGAFGLGMLAPGLSYTPLMVTSEQAHSVPRMAFDAMSPELLVNKLEGPPARATLGVLLAGRFPSVFKDVPPVVLDWYKAEKQPPPPHRAYGEGQGAVLALGDTDFAAERYAVREGQLGAVPMNDNLVLLYNAVQYLTGDGALLGVRGKGVQARNFTRVERMMVALSAKYARVEQKMAAELFQVASRLKALKAQHDGQASTQTLAEAARGEVAAYEERQLELRNQLRQVRGQLYGDVRRVEYLLAAFNMLLMPLLALGGWFWWRRRRLAPRG
ncbi:MAG: Gldg family protein [Pseudomonadaceae bacterium]|nr:Gldg family protein [Pseudomonadaceae bacterium]